MNTLENSTLGDPEKEDEIVWRLNEVKGFTVKSMYEIISTQSQKSLSKTSIWNPQIQLKVSFFVLKLWWDLAPTVDNLIRRGLIIIPNRCCLCLSAAESSSHLFLHCHWVMSMWNYFLSRLGVTWVQPESVYQVLECWLYQKNRECSIKGRELWNVIPAALWWCIWEEQNRRLFEGIENQPQKVLDDALSRLHNWIYGSSARDKPPYGCWVFDWDRYMFISV